MGTKQAFPDRREIMFGRKTDIDFILERIQKKGLTAVVGRPKMGKTWLLQEVGRELCESGHLVGYHECLGEPDQMLHVVSDLYSRWLLAAGNIEQARSLLERHKDSWVSKAGKAVGNLFSQVASVKGISEGIGTLVEDCFDGLSKADSDLRSEEHTSELQSLRH